MKSRVTVVGAGGLGGYLAAALSRAGPSVSVVVRGDHAAAVRAHGLSVHETGGGFTAAVDVLDDAWDSQPADLVFVTVKAYSLGPLLPRLAAIGKRGSVVVPLLNGVEAPGLLLEAGLPPDRLAAGAAYLTAFLTHPGHVERHGHHARLVVGHVGDDAAARAVSDVFVGTKVSVSVTSEIDVELWRKMIMVCGLTAACALTGEPIGPARSSEGGRAVLEGAVAEVLAVGLASGIPIPQEAPEEILQILDALPSDFIPSLIHDLRRGRRTEVDALNGAITRLGRQTGVATPVHDAAARSIVRAEMRGRRDG